MTALPERHWIWKDKRIDLMQLSEPTRSEFEHYLKEINAAWAFWQHRHGKDPRPEAA